MAEHNYKAPTNLLDWKQQINTPWGNPSYPNILKDGYQPLQPLPPPKEKEQGTKFDAGKPRMELIDADFERDLALVLTNGANKYEAENWRGGIKFKRLIGAIKRHVNAIERGEDIDPEWGLQHTAHLACEVMFLHWMTKNRKDLDDRYGNKAT
jgi:hypothetical protein